MATLETSVGAIQPNGSASPPHQQNETKAVNNGTPSNEAKRQGDGESSQDGPAVKRARTGDVEGQSFLINEDFQLVDIPITSFVDEQLDYLTNGNDNGLKMESNGDSDAQVQSRSKDELNVQWLGNEVIIVDCPTPVEAGQSGTNPVKAGNDVTQEHTGDDDEIIIIDSPIISKVAPGGPVQDAENIQPVQTATASNQETLNYAMAKDALGSLADCTAIRSVVSQAANVVHPYSWEKARDILIKVPPARDDYDIFKRLLCTWYTDRPGPEEVAEVETPGGDSEIGEEVPEKAEPDEDLADKVFKPYVAIFNQLLKQVENSKGEMRADKKFAAVNEDTQFLKKLADKLQDLWVRLMSSTDEKTLSFSRRVIAKELQEEIDQVLDHLDYKKQRDTEAEAGAEANQAAITATAEVDNHRSGQSFDAATDQTDVEISLINLDQEQDYKDSVDPSGAGGNDVNRQNQHSPTRDAAITPVLA